MESNSSQNASIFHEKNDGGVKKYFVQFLTPKNQIFKGFYSQKSTFSKKDASPGFWVKAF